MAASGRGGGTANDATVVTTSGDAPKVPVVLTKEEADARVAACEAKVERQRLHLAGAEQALADAIAERNAL